MNFQIFKLDLEKAEKLEIKLPISVGSLKKQESSRKTYTFALLTMTKLMTVGDSKLWKIPKEIGIPDHLICLLRHLYEGQEETVRTKRKNRQLPNWERSTSRMILSHCLFKLYAEYIMLNAGLDEAQARIKIAGRSNITSDTQMTAPLWQKAKKN